MNLKPENPQALWLSMNTFLQWKCHEILDFFLRRLIAFLYVKFMSVMSVCFVVYCEPTLILSQAAKSMYFKWDHLSVSLCNILMYKLLRLRDWGNDQFSQPVCQNKQH